LLRRGEGWLSAHPERETIARRYLRRNARLTREAVSRLTQMKALMPMMRRHNTTLKKLRSKSL
jgi:hypothetical protein